MVLLSLASLGREGSTDDSEDDDAPTGQAEAADSDEGSSTWSKHWCSCSEDSSMKWSCSQVVRMGSKTWHRDSWKAPTSTHERRVAPGSAPGAGLASAGKTRGEALQRAVPEGLPKHVKRAFRRARGRAARSLCGGTWYRGRWHDSSTLQALSRPSSRPVLSQSRTNRRPPRSSKTDLRMMSWNTSGLGGGVTPNIQPTI